ncbi:MAG: DUF4132 domain-containing protein [Gallionella sp.]
MQRFEFIEGNSSKFWEVSVHDTELTVCFGRIGTKGQTNTKSFASASAALKERDQLIKQKTGKGYRLVSSETATQAVVIQSETPITSATIQPVDESLHVVQPPPVISETVVVPLTATEPSPAVVATSNSSPSPVSTKKLEYPSGGFQWNDEWREHLPIVRGIHVPPLNTAEFSDFTYPRSHFNAVNKWDLGLLAQQRSKLGYSWTLWGGEPVEQHINNTLLSQASQEYWLQLLSQVWILGGNFNRVWVLWIIHEGISRHGLAFMFEVYVKFFVAKNADLMNSRYWQGLEGSFGYLRHHIACADETEYTQTLAVAERLRSMNIDNKVVCCYLFPHLADWVEELVAQIGNICLWFIKDGVIPLPLFLDNLSEMGGLYVPALFMQIYLQGDNLLPAFKDILNYNFSRTKGDLLQVLNILENFHSPQLLNVLVDKMEHLEVRKVLEKFAAKYPAAVLKLAMERTLSTHESLVQNWTIRFAVTEPAALSAALVELDVSQQQQFLSLLPTSTANEANIDALPMILRQPPWLNKTKPQPIPCLSMEEIATVEKIEFSPEELSYYKKLRVHFYDIKYSLGIKDECMAHLLAGMPLREEEINNSHNDLSSFNQVYGIDEPYRLLLWNSYPAKYWRESENKQECWDGWFKLLADYGTAAMPGLMAAVQQHPKLCLRYVVKVDSPQLVEPILNAFRCIKTLKLVGQQWIQHHPRTVLFKVFPSAFSPENSPKRDSTRHAIRWLYHQGYEAQVNEVASCYGAEMMQALTALLSSDPLMSSSKKIAKLPKFFVAATFHRPRLATGEVLPLQVMEHIGTMLASSSLDDPYHGLDIISHACSADSLAEFAWDIFEAWSLDGYSSKESWAFTALGLLGNDRTVRRLAPLIREWPGQSASSRAMVGLDILARIGSDVALVQLNSIANKSKFKVLKKYAQDQIAFISQECGYNSEEMADRLVSDLGLDENGALELDYGLRKFIVRIDDALKPQLFDQQGVRLKSLPRAAQGERRDQVKEAQQVYKQLQKEADELVRERTQHFEMSMNTQRRWQATTFKLLFIEHPVMRRFSTRLVWGVYENGQLQQCFRIAEDLTFADEHDDLYELSPDAIVGIPHLLELSAAIQIGFIGLFRDYGIIQPFKQLAREIYRRDENESDMLSFERFKGKVVNKSSLHVLAARGWKNSSTWNEGDWSGTLSKHFQVGAEILVDIGTDQKSAKPVQIITSVTLSHPEVFQSQPNPILISELLRDLNYLVEPV